jgi:hypothetical protein
MKEGRNMLNAKFHFDWIPLCPMLCPLCLHQASQAGGEEPIHVMAMGKGAQVSGRIDQGRAGSRQKRGSIFPPKRFAG